MLPKILNNWGVVILAAGKGTRLNCVDRPKVMAEIGGKPMVAYLVETLKQVGFTPAKICLVVGFAREKIMEYFGGGVSYAYQAQQKGTAHAAYTGIKMLPKNVEQVLVMNGDDGVFYLPETIKNFIKEHENAAAVLSLLTVEPDDPTAYGRIVRNGDKVMIVEKEYLTPEQKQIKETSSGTFCLNREWFENMFPHLSPLRKLGEYGLPTALAMANEQNAKINLMKLKNNYEWFGINTPAELTEAENRIKQK